MKAPALSKVSHVDLVASSIERSMCNPPQTCAQTSFTPTMPMDWGELAGVARTGPRWQRRNRRP